MNSPPPIRIAPPATDLMMFPPKIGTIKQTINGIVARSTSGKTLLPSGASAIAVRRVTGTRISDVAITAGCPITTAESKPI